MIISDSSKKSLVYKEQRKLNQRELLVLETLINEYIRSGDPIGSRTISKIIDLPLSPATIRNIMADLEDAGYLHQPYTSAGRVPTDQGFRYYVNLLLSTSNLKQIKSDDIQLNYSKIDTDTGEFLSYVSEYLSEVSGEAAIVLAPEYEKIKLKNINFVKLSGGKIIVIIESESGFVYDKIIKIDNSINMTELNAVQNYLNKKFSGKTISQVKNRITEIMKQEKSHYDELLSKVFKIAGQVFDEEMDLKHFEDLYIKGTSNILNNIEISDISVLKELISNFERKSFILDIINTILDDWKKDDIYICIGNEIPEDFLSRFSIITAPYLLKGENIGFLGIIGPKRMNYSLMIPLVNQIAKMVTGMFHGKYTHKGDFNERYKRD